MPQNYTSGPSPARVQAGLGYRPQRPVSQDSPVAYDGVTGDLTPAAGSVTDAMLTDTAVTPGTYGNATNVGQFTVDAKGRLTAAAAVPITFPADTGITQLTGDVTAGPGSGSQAATLATSGVSAASYGSATAVATFTVDAKGRLTAASNTNIAFPVPSVTFGTGAPGGTPADNALYFDDTLPIYIGYVGRSGTWHQF